MAEYTLFIGVSFISVSSIKIEGGGVGVVVKIEGAAGAQV